MEKTRFGVTFSLRISKDGSGQDKFTKEFIFEKLKSAEAQLGKGDLCNFIVWTKNNNQIMAQIESLSINN